MSQGGHWTKPAYQARLTLNAGFTTVRDLGARQPEVIYALRAAVAEGKVPGPRILCVGAILSPTGGHGQTYGFRRDVCACVQSSIGVCDGADGCRRAVRAQVAEGADAIKFRGHGRGCCRTPQGRRRPAVHHRGTDRDHRDGACAGPAGLGPCAWAGGDQRRPGRRGGFDRARKLPRRHLDRSVHLERRRLPHPALIGRGHRARHGQGREVVEHDPGPTAQGRRWWWARRSSGRWAAPIAPGSGSPSAPTWAWGRTGKTRASSPSWSRPG